jgi:hypothetical protein
MTLRNAYEFALIECNKLKVPSILLEDYIYLFNKAIQQYLNSVYNRAEYNQQSSDDLGFLQTRVVIKCEESNVKQDSGISGDKIYTLELPQDYVHMLNCLATFSGNNNSSKACKDYERTVTSSCHRLTADLYPAILNNYYLRPTYKRPYYYIINTNTETSDKQINRDNEYVDEEGNPKYGYNPVFEKMSVEKVGDLNSNDDNDEETVFRFYDLKDVGDRTANQSAVDIEIHCGKSNWKLNNIIVTYVKAPQYVSMTHDQLLAVEDNTPVLEFPDYICYEIINIFVRLLLENMGDPRLATNAQLNNTIQPIMGGGK